MKTNRRDFIKGALASICGALLTRAGVVMAEAKSQGQRVLRPVLELFEELPPLRPLFPPRNVPGKLIFLDPWNGDGSDTEGDGSIDKPFATMQRAINDADSCAQDFIICLGKCESAEEPSHITMRR